VIRRFAVFVCLIIFPGLAAAPHGCVGSVPLATFQFSVAPANGGQTLPLRQVNALRKGQNLLYQPLHLPPAVRNKAEIALLLAPQAGSHAPIEALKPAPAAKSAMWTVPRDASVVALVYGPQGLSMRKVRSLMKQNDEVLSELADYADQTAQVSALIQALQESESSGSSMSAALSGFSAQYGVAVPALDTHAATTDQALTLLHALQPAMSSMDPLTGTDAAVTRQSAGLATAVASLFFGNPVGLMVGGASLFQNMRTMMFPETEFRSIIAQTGASGSFALCAKTQSANKARTRVAYLWAHRLPDLPTPKLSLPAAVHLPIGAKSVVTVQADKGLKDIAHLRDWQLTAVKGGETFHVPVTLTKKPGEVELDLSKAKAAPGEYHLKAFWDWDDLPVTGDVYLHPLGDLKLAKLAPECHDKLVAGSGKVALKLQGTDFEFIDKVTLEKSGARAGAQVTLAFDLPHRKRAGPQETMDAALDTTGLKAGEYKLLLVQSDAPPHAIPVTVLPPNPKIEDLPLRPNLGEPSQKFVLHGSGLDRIEKITTKIGEIDLPPSRAAASREAVVKLSPQAHKGDMFDLCLKVKGLDAPLTVPDAVEILGPRPRITALRKSNPQDFGLTLEADEIPASVTASFALTVAHAGDAPVVDITCADPGPLRRRLRLSAGDHTAGASLDMAGEGELFLSLDPSAVGRSGCRLEARVTSAEGSSDPYLLGRILRVPRIEQFVLTDEKLGDAVYAGLLKGEDLDTIAQTGWDAQHGLPVESIPTPIAGEPQKQVLKIQLPWPAPAPHAPVFVWLRGESKGRDTGVKY